MLSISNDCFEMLAKEAKDRGVNIQMLLRAVVIPEWSRLNPNSTVSTVNKISGSMTSTANTKVDVSVFSHIANTPWPEFYTDRSLYLRNIRSCARSTTYSC